METVLLTSGYPPAAIVEAKKRWHVVDIHSQREALAHLQGMVELPAAISIGYVAMADGTEELNAKEMLAAIQKIDPSLPVIISTGQSSPGVIVDLVKRGAFDYVVEPANRNANPEALAGYVNDLMLALTRAVQWRSLVRENLRLKQEQIKRSLPQSIQVRSPEMLGVMELVRKVAPTSATVLVTGESGTGKELIARAIHDLSPHVSQPFTAINCGAISPTLLTSELFGHVRGAFTGADSNRKGLIREAGTGTLFLDEIGTVSEEFQVLLLRVLDEHRARPVGGGGDYPVRCRFIAAANRNLEEMVRRGEFREDLFYRLNLFHIHLPPLRRRKGEIPVLVYHFLRQSAAQYHKKIDGIEPAAMSLLEASDWPGNVRQLRNTIERAVIVCDGQRVGIADLGDPSPARGDAPGHAPAGNQSHQQAMSQFERQIIRQAMERAAGNLSQAARLLNMKRTTLSYRIRQLGLRS